MKQFKMLFAAMLMLAMIACTTMQSNATPEAKFIATATQATLLVDQVTLAATAAVNAGKLHGDDAKNTLMSIKVARDGIEAARLLNPAQGVDKIGITLATLTATQTYLKSIEGAK